MGLKRIGRGIGALVLAGVLGAGINGCVLAVGNDWDKDDHGASGQRAKALEQELSDLKGTYDKGLLTPQQYENLRQTAVDRYAREQPVKPTTCPAK